MKRSWSALQETRSFSSPDLLLLAQQLQQQQHGSPAVSQDAAEAGSADAAALPAASTQAQNGPGPLGTAAIPRIEDGQATIGSRFLKAVQDAAEGTGDPSSGVHRPSPCFSCVKGRPLVGDAGLTS